MPTLDNCLRAYRVCARAEGRSEKTIRLTTQAVSYFAAFLGGPGAGVGAIGPDSLRGFITALREKRRWTNHPYHQGDTKKLSPFSIATYVRHIKAFWSWLAREGYIETNTLAKVKVPKCPEKAIPTLSRSELVAVLKQIDSTTWTGFRDHLVLLALLDTACRVGELTGARVEDLDLEGGAVKVLGKGGRERWVPLGRTVTRLMAKWLAKYLPEGHDGPLFLTTRGTRLTPERVEKTLAGYSLKALGKRVHPHQLRHTAAVEWLRGKGDPFTLQKLLGHRQLSTTRIYVNLADADLKEAHRRVGVCDRLRL